jgi:hypothetical protein
MQLQTLAAAARLQVFRPAPAEAAGNFSLSDRNPSPVRRRTGTGTGTGAAPFILTQHTTHPPRRVGASSGALSGC